MGTPAPVRRHQVGLLADRWHSVRPAPPSQPSVTVPSWPAPLPARLVGDRRQALAGGRRGGRHWYLDAGYQIVARNWRCRDGEIDIVARAPGAPASSSVK